MHVLTIGVQVGLWSVAGYVAVHIYEDWKARRKTPTIQTYSNAITGGKRHGR
jgi:hypothetical protein